MRSLSVNNSEMWERRRNKKKEIFEATFNCIYEQGIAEVSLRSIAAKIGSNQSLVHYYFKSKENLLIEFISHLFDEIFDIEAVVRKPDPPEKKFDDLLKAAESFLETKEKMFIVFIDCWSLSIRNKTMRKIFSRLYKKNRKFIEEIIKEGQREGVFNREINSDILSVSIISYAGGLALQRFMVRDPIDLQANLAAWANALKSLLMKECG